MAILPRAAAHILLLPSMSMIYCRITDEPGVLVAGWRECDAGDAERWNGWKIWVMSQAVSGVRG